MIYLRTSGAGLGAVPRSPFEVPLPGGGVMYSWYNPLDWVETAAGWVSDAGGWAWDGTKWVFGKVLDKCTYVLGPFSLIPGGKKVFQEIFATVSSKLGPLNTCTPEGQAIATAAFTSYAAAHGVDPNLAALISTFGVALVVECICKSGGINAVNPPTGGPPDGDKKKIPWGPIAAIGAVVLLGGVAIKRSR